jgi:predicted AlkP superfamily pyrophosphatase or phosphodiesterase
MTNRLAGVVLFAAALLGARTTIFAADAAPAADSDSIVVMISVDGLAGYYIDDPKAEMPTIRQLAKEGARADSMRAIAPTVTWPNHTTLVTGDYSNRHGVVGNNYYDRETGKQVTLIGDPVFDKDKIVKVPTIYDLAKQAGLRTASIRWPASRNAKTLDWTMPDVLNLETMRQYTTPSVLEESRADGHPLDTDDPKDPGKIGQLGPQDDADTRAFIRILHEHRPQLALLHLIIVDHTEHAHGPRSPEAYAAVKEADQRVHDVLDELNRDFPGKATLLVVADHGFSPIERAILPNVILRNAGMLNVKGLRIVGGSVHVVVQGGAAMIYILDSANRDAIIDKVTKAFQDVEGVEKVLGPDGMKQYHIADPKTDPHAPDMMLFADEGCTFGDTAGGALSFIEKPERKGTHGHDPLLPDLHATFVAWGQGIQSGTHLGEIKNIDVAPTIAALLHIDMPNTDGHPLTKILSK